MLIAVVVGIVAVLAALEILSLVFSIKSVYFRCETDMELTEPDEIATLSFRVSNRSFWPLMFVSFSFIFNDAVEVRESREWLDKHAGGSMLTEFYTYDTYLMPKTAFRRKLHFSIKKRGCFDLGKIYIETGDFLGLKTRVMSFSLDKRIVCTAKPCEDEPDLAALGGIMGELSVRRFIMEDPSLVLGYREYTGTEPFKSISWTQTAKTGRLTVKKHDFTVDNDVAVIVDLEFTEPEVRERCLSLVRTACDFLEENRIPYALHSNGDLFDTAKGIGRTHSFEIQRRLGVSMFTRFVPFEDTVQRSIGGGYGRTGCIVIAPEATPETAELTRRLSEHSGAPVCLLLGKGESA